LTAPAKMLLIYLDETDLWHAQPLYEAIVRRLRQAGLAGATVTYGIMGYGSHRKVHHKRLFGISDDKPVTITVVDEEVRLRAIVPEIRGMVKEGLMVLMDVEVVEPGTD
jgi:PII-like signaling protein